jgi:16S rRNA (guanine(966)-N(2))-methyltransferase RsmD
VRIIGGRLGGRVLRVPAGLDVRPTPDRVRESLFSALGDVWEGRAVLDLFAGSGCLAFESLSRGAAHATLVERDARTFRALEDSVAALGLGPQVRLLRADAQRALARLAREGERFDAVWLDPPYAGDELMRALDTLGPSGLLAEGAIVVAEHPTRAALADEPVPRLVARDRRRYGDTAVTVYRYERGPSFAPGTRNRAERGPPPGGGGGE